MSLRLSTPKSEFLIQDVASLGCGATIFILRKTASKGLVVVVVPRKKL